MPNGNPQVKTFLKMDKDTDPRFLSDGAYIHAENWRVGLISEGTASIESVKGNSSLNLTLPDNGYTKCVGLHDDKRNNNLFVFIYNHEWIDLSGGSTSTTGSTITFTVNGHGLREYDEVTFYGFTGTLKENMNGVSYTVTNVTTNTFDIENIYATTFPTLTLTTASLLTTKHKIISYNYKNELISTVIDSHYLDFQLDEPIKRVNVLLDYLTWTDGSTEPKALNYKRAIAGDYPKDGSGNIVWEKDYITNIKLMPSYPMYGGVQTNSSIDNSTISQRAYQFRCRWVYKDGQKSAFSPMSIIFPTGDDFNTERNTINLRVPFRDNYSDSEQVITEVYYSIQSDLGDFNSGSWYLFDSFDRRTMPQTITTDNTPYNRIPEFYYDNYITIAFTGSNDFLLVTDSDDLAALNDGVPIAAKTQTVIESNRLVYGGTTERYDLPDVELATSVEFNEADTYTDPAQTLKAGARHNIGIIYYDEFMRSGSVQTVTVERESSSPPSGYDGHSNPYIPFWGEIRTAASGAPNSNGIPSIDFKIVNQPPSWAKYWSLAHGGNDKTNSFFQSPTHTFEYYDSRGNKRLAHSFYEAQNTFLEDGGQYLNYTYQNGDKLRVIASDAVTSPTSFTGTYLDFQIDEYIGSFLYGEAQSFDQVNSLTTGTFPELAPYLCTIENGGNPLSNVNVGDKILLTFTSPPAAVAPMENRVFTVVATEMFGHPTTIIAIDSTIHTSLGGASHTVTAEAQSTRDDAPPAAVTDYSATIAPNTASVTSKRIVTEVYTPKKQIGEDAVIWKETGVWGGVYFWEGEYYHLTQFNNVSDGALNQTSLLDAYFRLEWDGIISDGSSTNNNSRRIISDTYYSNTLDDTYPQAMESTHAVQSINSQSYSFGRPNKIIEGFERTTYGNRIRWGQPNLNDKTDRNINKFYSLDIKELGIEYGDIVNLFDQDRSLMTFQTDKVGIIPVNQYVVSEQTGAAIVGRTKSVLSDTIYLDLDYGLSIGANGVDNFNGTYFFGDEKRGVVCRATKSGMSEISANGMSKYFKNKFSEKSGYENFAEYSQRWESQCVVDKDNEEVIFTLRKYADLAAASIVSGGSQEFNITPTSTPYPTIPNGTAAEVIIYSDAGDTEALRFQGSIANFTSGSTTSFNVSSFSEAPNLADILSEMGLTSATSKVTVLELEETVVFNMATDGWSGFYSFLPEVSNQLGFKYVTSKNGQVYIHSDEDEDVATFYGTTYNSKIKTVCNDTPVGEKVFNSLNAQMRVEDGSGLVTDADISAEHTTQQGQLSTTEPSEFKYHEGYYNSNIYRDENTPNVGLPKYNGDPMRDTALITELEYDNTEQSTKGRRVVNILNLLYTYAKSFI